MEKAEVMGYLSLGVFVAILVFSIYTLNFKTTGLAVFSQNDFSSFNVSGATFENVSYNSNLSAIALNENQTFGSYTSQIYDAENNSAWNNLTWTGAGTLAFEVRNCTDASCSNSSFSSADLNNLNLTGQYFQYKVSFSSNDSNLASVNIDYSPIISSPTVATSVSLSQPSGTKTSQTGISLNFTIAGTGLSCWYNIHDASDNALITDNTTIQGCNSTSFDLGTGQGSYILNIYSNGTSGFASDSSDFSVSLSSQTNEEEEEETESTIQVPVTAATSSESAEITSISLQSIETIKLNPSDSYNYNLIVVNNGDNAVSSCELNAAGDFVSWLNVSSASKNINAGSQESFAFKLDVPANSTLGLYEFKLSANCAEILKESSFAVNIVKKNLEFNITDVARTRDDNVRVRYSLKDLAGEAQNITFNFLILDVSNKQVANLSENYSLPANSTRKLSANIPINESLNGTLTLSVNYNSKEDSYSVREPITLGSPTGFLVLGDIGTTGSVAIGAGIIILAVAVFFFARRFKIFRKQKSEIKQA